MNGCAALIVAAGRGRRLGGGSPKQYMQLGGKAMLRRTVEAFSTHPKIDFIQVVINASDKELYVKAMEGLAIAPPIAGGKTRQESVRLGLENLESQMPKTVLIHDAARPLIDAATIGRVVDALVTERAAIAAVTVADTLKREDAGHIAVTIDRVGLWRAQTPQGFCFSEIIEAHRQAKNTKFTDDAAIAEAAGIPVGLVSGTEANFKVTTADDFVRAEQMVADSKGLLRVGQGFDLHRFGPGDHVMICGVSIPYSQGIEAHSDGDVGLHALTDAILGAIGKGDIGTHFPPSDPKWQDVDSTVFLQDALTRLNESGGRIHNLDIMLICEEPKIVPYRDKMLSRIAAITGLPESAINVKATTTEGLGFLGKKEAIAAQAIATVVLPT